MKHWDKYDLGGVFDVFDFDKKMALINLDMIYEYAIKLDTIVTEESNLEEWVKMKLTRVEQNVSDVAHSLEGWEKFDEGGMIFKKQLLSISKYAHKLIEMIKGGSKLMSWQENKLAISANDIDNLYHHLDYKVGNRASQNKFATGGMMKYPDLSNETPIVINEPNNQKISEIDIALIDIALVRQDLGIEKTKIGSSNDAYQIFKQLWNKDSINVREEMNVLFLNNANEPIGYYEHTKGAINSTLVDVEMIGALALKTLSKGVILAHNHPSGNNKPSEADIKLYQQVKTALKMFNVTVLDSMILVPNSDNYYSLADNGYEMGGMVLSNKEIIKNIDFSDNTDRRLGRYDFSFETEDSEGASILDYDGYIIEAPSSSRMNDEIEWGQNVPEDWENAEKYILDEFYNWKLKRFKNGGGVGVYRIVEGYDHYKGMPLYHVIGDNDYIGEYHTDRKDAEKELQELIGSVGIKFYALWSDGMRNKKRQEILYVGYWKGRESKHQPTLENIKEFLAQVPFDESISIYTDDDTSFYGKLHSAYTPLYTAGAESVDAIVDSNDNIIWNKYEESKYFLNPSDYMENGGGVDDKKLYEIVFEDVFSFSIAKREANLTNSQYNKALQQIKDKTIVVDRFNKSSGVHEQLRIKEIKPIFAKGGGVDYKIVAFPEAFMYKYFVVDEDNDNYLTVQADMFDKWKNASKIEKAEYYSEWIPKNEMVEVMANGGGVGEFPEEGETILPKDIDYDMMDYLSRTNKKLLVTLKDGEKVKSSVGKFYNDLIFHGKLPSNIQHSHYSIQKKQFEKVQILNSDEYANGGGVSSELSEPQKEFSKSAEMLVRENLQNGEICMCKLKKILGHEPNYPKQVIGSLVLEKAYLRNYYKI